MKIWKMDSSSIDLPALQEAANFLKAGQLVAFPTETVYGLGGNGLNPEALCKIFVTKGRPGDNPLILHISDCSQINELVAQVTPSAEILMENFWPGPLTLVLPKSKKVPYEATGGLESVAIRMPSHPIALALIDQVGLPVAAPSANLSGKPSPTNAQDVIEDLAGKIAGVIDGGSTELGLESTVVDCTGPLPMILRPGSITLEMLEEVVGLVEVDQALMDEKEKPRAPGMKYAHYAPRAKLVILEDFSDVAEMLQYARGSQKKISFISLDEIIDISIPKNVARLQRGTLRDIAPLVADFYGLLREMDRQAMDEIYILAVPEVGLGVALMNRMKKAAIHRYWKAEGRG